MKKNLLLTLLLLLATCPLSAQTSFPMLGGVLPVGVERGKTATLTLYGGGNGGANLNGTYKAMVEGKGVSMEVVPPEKGYPKADAKTPWSLPGVTEIKLKVTVAADADLGIREFRVATERAGLSTIGQIIVCDEPQIVEVEPNNTIAQAQKVTLPVGVNGRLQQGEDVDYYRFKAEAGQDVTFAVHCARLEDKVHDLQEHADSLIVLSDTSGVEIARNDDYYRADPLLSYRFAKAGEYILQIRDVGYKGNPYWNYHLQMTTRPYITSTIPCAVRAGQSAELTLGGFHLGGTQKVRIDVPGDLPDGIWQTPLKLPNGTTNPIFLCVTHVPQTSVEPDPAGNRPITAGNAPIGKPLAIPGGVSSWLAKDGQVDRYTFKAKQGEGWGFEVTSRRLDSSVDSEIKIKDAKGNVLAANDDFEGSKDSRLEWSAPANGDFTVEVRDLTGKSGATYFYNLTAERLTQDFKIRCDTDRAMIAPGNRTSWYAMIERRHGFTGEVKVEVKGLPAGMTVTPLTIPANMTVGTLILTASADAKKDASLVEVVGTAMATGLDSKPIAVSRIATPMSEIYMPGGGRGLLATRTQGVAISDTNDLEVTADVRELTLKPGETRKINITIKRRPDYTKAVTLDARVQHLGGIFVDPLPPGVTVDDATIPENQTKGVVTIHVAPNAQLVKDVTLSLFANASINFVMKVWYSAEPIKLTIQK